MSLTTKSPNKHVYLKNNSTAIKTNPIALLPENLVLNLELELRLEGLRPVGAAHSDGDHLGVGQGLVNLNVNLERYIKICLGLKKVKAKKSRGGDRAPQQNNYYVRKILK